MTQTLFLAWQNPLSRSWYPIGRLTSDETGYQFVYTQGVLEAKSSGFEPLKSFPELEKVYQSKELFPLFSNRVMPRSRPDYPNFIQWLNIPQHEDDPIALLARSGGERATDTFEVFPYPEADANGFYHIHFFAHGLRHLPACSVKRIHELQTGEQLFLAHEFQNPYDRRALILCTLDHHILGYCPRYLLDDAFEVLRSNPDSVKIYVEQVNFPPTPYQFRLLCNLTAKWQEDFPPFSSSIYQPLKTLLTTS